MQQALRQARLSSSGTAASAAPVAQQWCRTRTRAPIWSNTGGPVQRSDPLIHQATTLLSRQPAARRLHTQTFAQAHDSSSGDDSETNGSSSARTLTSDPLKIALCRNIPNTLLLEDTPLPSLQQCRHFVNLTNGLGALPLLDSMGLPSAYVRICSTDVEQANFEELIRGLDANLLMSLALGYSCCIWDMGSRNKSKGAPRALWGGLEFVRFCLETSWRPAGAPPPQAHLRGHRVTREFESKRRALSGGTRRRLEYYKRYVPPGAGRVVQLYGVYKVTTKDADAEHWVSLAREWDAPGAAERQRRPALGRDTSVSAVAEEQSMKAVAPSWEVVLEDGWGVFAGGMGHADYFPALKAMGAADEGTSSGEETPV